MSLNINPLIHNDILGIKQRNDDLLTDIETALEKMPAGPEKEQLESAYDSACATSNRLVYFT